MKTGIAACFERSGGTAPHHLFDTDGVCVSCGTTYAQWQADVRAAQGPPGALGATGVGPDETQRIHGVIGITGVER